MDENLREATEFPEKNETTAAEADEPKTKSIHFKVSAYDPRGIEQWLSERAAEGKLLLRGDEFVIGEPCECRYHLEPALDDADPDKRTRETRAQMGWDYVCRTKDGIFYIWRGGMSARAPSPRPCTDSYGYRRLRKKMRGSYFLPLVSLAAFAAIVYILAYLPELPILSLITMTKSAALQIIALLLSCFLALLSDAQERREMRALKRAMEDCERTEKMQRNRWARLNRLLGIVMSVLPLMLIVSVGSGSPYSEAYDEPTLPYLRAEELGGDPFDWCYQRDLSTPLGGHVYSVGETPHAGMIDDWEQLSTEVDFYAPRISALAKPLTRELRDYFMGSGAQTLSIDGFDEAYYAEFIKPNTRLPNEPDEVHQFLILRRGGEVLYFRTAAGDDLRDRLEEFAELFDQYAT
ncbi:MAG: hypothetical protein SO060_02930 [Oscillospiraceae bacterium]|nr:hypothetical protein [Oscillibacter sp.]MDY5017479.1 hypothetical protein [Oscillospiraceae bacterium]